MRILYAFIAGILFSLGLWVSDMVNPNRIIGFLDIFGVWDSALLFVMSGALIIAVPGFFLLKSMKKTLTNDDVCFPRSSAIDKKLIIGATLFGIGWGLIGLCPGPVISVIPVALKEVILFVLAMCIGMIGANKLFKL